MGQLPKSKHALSKTTNITTEAGITQHWICESEFMKTSLICLANLEIFVFYGNRKFLAVSITSLL
jgi:hypothetical protein